MFSVACRSAAGAAGSRSEKLRLLLIEIQVRFHSLVCAHPALHAVRQVVLLAVQCMSFVVAIGLTLIGPPLSAAQGLTEKLYRPLLDRKADTDRIRSTLGVLKRASC